MVYKLGEDDLHRPPVVALSFRFTLVSIKEVTSQYFTLFIV